MASAYIAIANGSPCVVPSLELISPSPTMKSLIGTRYVLLRMVDIAGHVNWMLWRAACLLIELNAFDASTCRIASVSSNANIPHVMRPHILLHVQHMFVRAQQQLVHHHWQSSTLPWQWSIVVLHQFQLVLLWNSCLKESAERPQKHQGHLGEHWRYIIVLQL